jgi:hypothetical protein
MAVQSLVGVFVQISAAMSATAAGGTVAATGALTAPTDISQWVTAVEDGLDLDTKDVTAFGSGGYSAFVAGLKTGVLTMSLMNDYAAAATNAVLGINGSVIPFGSTGFVEIRPVNAARSATNPGFVAKVINTGWRPIKASVGDVPMVSWAPKVTGWSGELIA